jgi:hypothetical protein
MAGFDIIRIRLPGVLEHQTRHSVDRDPSRTLAYRAGYCLFQKPDRHAPGNHPIAQATL